MKATDPSQPYDAPRADEPLNGSHVHVQIVSTEELANDPVRREYLAKAAAGLKGTETLTHEERRAVAKLRFQLAANVFAESPSTANWRDLDVAMSAYQSVENER